MRGYKYMNNLQELVCQAHMAGQKNQGHCDPSWSEAHAYWSSLDEVNMLDDNLNKFINKMKDSYNSDNTKYVMACAAMELLQYLKRINKDEK